MKINEFYKSVLSVGGLSVDDSDRLIISMGDGATPYTTDGKRVVLPTQEWMRQDNQDERVFFHPLKESIHVGESAVFGRFRKAVNIRLHMTLCILFREIIRLGASPGLHAQLPPTQLDFLKLLKDADEKTLKEFVALEDAMPMGDTEHCIVNIYLKNKATIKGKMHRRGAIVTFPLYQQLCSEEPKVWGVKVSAKNRQLLKKLLEHTFPGIEEEGAYNRGSESDSAPFLDALLRAVQAIDDNVNDYVEDLGGVLELLKDLPVDSAWREYLGNFEAFTAELRHVPMQPGNERAAEEVKPAGGWQATPNMPAPPPNANAPRDLTKRVSFNDAPPQQQPQYQQNNGWAQQSQGWACEGGWSNGGNNNWAQPRDGATAARSGTPSWAIPGHPNSPIQQNTWGGNNSNNGNNGGGSWR